MADGAASAKVAAGAGQQISPAEVAAGAPSVEVAADAYPAEKSRPRGRWLAEYGSAPTDPEAPPIWLNTTMSDQPDTTSVGRAQPHEPTEAERNAQVGATRAACVDVVRISSHKVAGPDEGQFDSMRVDLHKGWCKKPRAKTRWLRMWTWPDSSSTW